MATTQSAPATVVIAVTCRMRELRGKASLREFEALTGIDRGDLTKIERRGLLPLPKHVEALERVYGPRGEWFAAEVRIEEAGSMT